MAPSSSLILTPLILLSTLALTIGLTYAPCYAGICIEEYHPYVTRLHIAHFWALLGVAALALGARALHPPTRRLSEWHLTTTPLPWVRKRVSLGGLALGVWIGGVTAATTGIWWGTLYEYWVGRGQAVEYTVGALRLTLTGVTGHWCDILAGLVVLPISRGGVLGRVFGVHLGTVLYAHKIVAYGLLVCALVHMVAFYSWVPTFAHAPTTEQQEAFNIDNPYQSIEETEERGYWYNTVLPSGLASFIAFLVMAFTSLPRVRRLSYNTFYYAHLICSALFFFMISIHASTDFYLLLPGLALWIVDWVYRLRWLSRKDISAELKNTCEGWFEITLPGWIPRAKDVGIDANPLQTYYLNFPGVSKAQCHAFTAASMGSANEGPTFVFRKAQGKDQEKLDKEWTWKLAALVESERADAEARQTLPIRLEGPYSPPASEMFCADQILCVVGGTGITGALSIAEWWLSQSDRHEGGRFRLVWTIRTPEVAQLRQVNLLSERIRTIEGFEIVVHISNTSGRLDVGETLRGFFSGAEANEKSKKSNSSANQRGWVYCSGPEGLLESAETACLRFEKDLKAARKSTGASDLSIKELSWYAAKWDV